MDVPQTWPRCPQADAFFAAQMQAFLAVNPDVTQMAARLREQAGVSILNLVDHWLLPASDALSEELCACGLTPFDLNLFGVAIAGSGETVWEHTQARFPRVRLSATQAQPRLALAVDDIEHFLEKNPFEVSARAGRRGEEYREAIMPLATGELAVVSRVGSRGFTPMPRITQQVWTTRTKWSGNALAARRRDGDDLEVIAGARRGLEGIIAEVGRAVATDLFFAAEREYYMTRNAAARWQYAQQQELGFGWANHDHHTYRSSRQSFRALMQLFLLMGFEMRERFYAGAEAGWGAQILEHPVSRVVIFADVDMEPQELDIDFAAQDLPPRQTLGTIGLWCALHGSSIAQAGMHHLECEFEYAQACNNLRAAGYGVMAPFTDLPMLKQAFTQPEIWPVAPERLQILLDAGSITAGQAVKFRANGAPGSHLEILQRWDGFKGFNKTGVSNIIRATDARNSV